MSDRTKNSQIENEFVAFFRL